MKRRIFRAQHRESSSIKKRHETVRSSSKSASRSATLRSLTRKHQQLWHGLNQGRASPLFNLDAFAATTVAAGRSSVIWRRNVEFECRGGATVPVICTGPDQETAGVAATQSGVSLAVSGTGESDGSRNGSCDVAADSPASHSSSSTNSIRTSVRSVPGVYLSATPDRHNFLSVRSALLDSNVGVDEDVQRSVLLAIFTSSDCDCFITAAAIAQCMATAEHKPFILQEVRPFNPGLCKAMGGTSPSGDSGYRIPCQASRLRSGHLRVMFKDVRGEDIRENIPEQDWEKVLVDEEKSLRSAVSHALKWQLQLNAIGLAESCHIGVGTRQACSGITSGFYHPDWLFSDPQTGSLRSAEEVLGLSEAYSQLPFPAKVSFFETATPLPQSVEGLLLSSCEPEQLGDIGVASHGCFLSYVRQQCNRSAPIVLFSGGGVATLLQLAMQMSHADRRRVIRIGLMLLTTDPSSSVLRTPSGHGVSYNEAINPEATAKCFLKTPARTKADDIPLRTWFPNAAIYIWNTMSSKGQLEQDL